MVGKELTIYKCAIINQSEYIYMYGSKEKITHVVSGFVLSHVVAHAFACLSQAFRKPFASLPHKLAQRLPQRFRNAAWRWRARACHRYVVGCPATWPDGLRLCDRPCGRHCQIFSWGGLYRLKINIDIIPNLTYVYTMLFYIILCWDNTESYILCCFMNEPCLKFTLSDSIFWHLTWLET